MAGNRKEHELLMKLTAALGSNFNSTFQTAMNTTNKLQTHISSLNKTQGDISQFQKAEAAVKSLKEEKARLEAAGGNNEKQLDKVNKQLAVQEGKLADVSGRLKAAGVDTNNLTEESKRLKAEQDRLIKSQEDLAKATKAVEENKKALSATKKELLVTMGKVTVAAAAIYKGAIEPAAKFEASMADIRAQTGMSAADIENLGGIMREMGRQGRHGGQDIAEAYAAVAVRGQDVAHSSELMRTAMVLADATGSELKDTAYFLGNYLMKIGKDSSYAEQYINVFAKTVQGTGIGLDTLQDYLFRANASLQLAGISGTEATAIFGNLYQAGIRGANAYSGFQQTIQSLMLPSDNAAAALQTLNICVSSMKESGLDMTEIMFQVGDALEHVEDNTERLALMKDLFSSQTAFAFADELFNQRDVLRDLIPELYDAGSAAHGMGTAYAIAGDRNSGFAYEMEKTKNTLNDIRISIGTALMPVLNDLMGGFSEGAGKVAEWAAENKELIALLTKLAMGLAAAKIGYLGIKTVVLKVQGVYLGLKKAIAAYKAAKVAAAVAGKKLTIVQWLLNKAMLANPIGLVVIAVMGLIAGVVALVKNWDKVKEAAQKVWQVIKDVFGRIKDFFIGVWEAIKAAPMKVFNWFKDNWQNVLLFILNPFAAIFKYLYENFEGFRNFVDGVVQAIKNAFAAVWEFIKGVFSAVGGFFSGVWGTITGVFSNVVGWFGDKFRAAWEAIKGVFSAVGGFFKGIWDNIVGIFGKVGTAVGDAIGGAFKAVVNGVVGFVEKIINGFFGTINRAIGLINKIPGVNIPLIPVIELPKLYKGSNNTPDNFIAGDINGKGGEIVANARGRKVFTAAETTDILKNINAAKAINKQPPPVSDSDTRKPPTMAERVGGLIGAIKSVTVNRAEDMKATPPALQSTKGGGQSWKVEFKTTVHVNGETPGDLDTKLQQNNETMLAMFKEFLRKQRDDEGRAAYA